jgi:hypothetical protein
VFFLLAVQYGHLHRVKGYGVKINVPCIVMHHVPVSWIPADRKIVLSHQAGFVGGSKEV